MDTRNSGGNDPIPHARKGGTNPAAKAPKKMRESDKQYIDTKLKRTFIKDHAMNVHQSHMDLVHKNALDNTKRRKSNMP
jgi:hypothetical protein